MCFQIKGQFHSFGFWYFPLYFCFFSRLPFISCELFNVATRPFNVREIWFDGGVEDDLGAFFFPSLELPVGHSCEYVDFGRPRWYGIKPPLGRQSVPAGTVLGRLRYGGGESRASTSPLVQWSECVPVGTVILCGIHSGNSGFLSNPAVWSFFARLRCLSPIL
jgi:hypothetical protein